MSSVSFFTPVSYCVFPNSIGKSILEKVDDYFFLKGRKVQVIPGYQKGNSEGVLYTPDQKSSATHTAIKVVSYFTLVLPAIALMAKVVLRCIYKFYLINFLPVAPITLIPPNLLPPGPPPRPYLGFPPAGPSESSATDPRLKPSPLILPFDVPVLLTCEEVLPLKIRRVTELLPNGTYKVDKGFSDLDIYKDSFFYCSSPSYDKYKVTRKRIDGTRDYPYIPVGKETYLSIDQFRQLNIRFETLQFFQGFAIATSDLLEYKNSQFVWSELPDGRVRIYRR